MVQQCGEIFTYFDSYSEIPSHLFYSPDAYPTKPINED